ncbi:MAG TPA: hypothetical protein V6C96_05120 [Vampirovibrionales bacterium]
MMHSKRRRANSGITKVKQELFFQVTGSEKPELENFSTKIRPDPDKVLLQQIASALGCSIRDVVEILALLIHNGDLMITYPYPSDPLRSQKQTIDSIKGAIQFELEQFNCR